MMYKNDLVAVVRVNGKILRELENNVFLPFGSEYSLRIKNLKPVKASVKVSIDGNDVLDGRALIVDPNSHVDLERAIVNGDLTSGRKFKFIEKTNEISDYRGDKIDDGIVRIEYQFEQQYDNSYVTYRSPWVSHNHFTYDSYTAGAPISKGIVGATGAVNGISGQTARSLMNTVGCASASYSAPQNEAGITVEGSASNQSFSNGFIGYLNPTKYTITFQLKGMDVGSSPVSQPVLVTTKKKCPSCGTEYKSNKEYCSKDGTYLRVV